MKGFNLYFRCSHYFSTNLLKLLKLLSQFYDVKMGQIKKRLCRKLGTIDFIFKNVVEKVAKSVLFSSALKIN